MVRGRGADRTGSPVRPRSGYTRASAHAASVPAAGLRPRVSAFVVRNLPDLRQAFGELRRVPGTRAGRSSPSRSRSRRRARRPRLPRLLRRGRPVARRALVGARARTGTCPSRSVTCPRARRCSTSLSLAGFGRALAVPHSRGDRHDVSRRARAAPRRGAVKAPPEGCEAPMTDAPFDPFGYAHAHRRRSSG